MATTLSPVDLSNIALSKIGAQAINSLQDGTNNSAIQCNLNFQLAYLAVSRSARWNCLLTTANLVPIAQTPIPQSTISPPPTSTPWAPLTLYQAGVYVSYGGAYYSVPTSYTSSSSFATDLAAGHLVLYNQNGSPITTATPWAQNTFYQANAFVTYGGYYYQIMVTYTSSQNFFNDLNQGFLVQTDQQAGSTTTDFQSLFCDPGSQYPSGWAYQYALPADFLLLAILNDNICWDFEGAGGDDYELMASAPNGQCLFTDKSIAIIQYIQNQPDTTRFDPMMADAFTWKLAAALSTPLRQDGGRLAEECMKAYEVCVRQARAKNGGEQKARRFNAIRSSRFTRARYGGVNG